MIEKLRHIVTQVAGAPDLASALEQAVSGIREAMRVDACAAWLVDPLDDHLVLMEADGLDRGAIGRARRAPGEGVVGLVRERREPLALEDIQAHPRFRPFPGDGGARFRGFLGVPMIHRRKVLGVLVVCRRSRTRFGSVQEAFLVTVSAQLAGTLAPTLVHARGQRPIAAGSRAGFLQGVAGAPGIAIGVIVEPSPLADLEAVPDRDAADPDLEVAAFREAVAVVQAELLASGERMQGLMPSEAHALFEVYATLVGDESLTTGVINRIRAGAWAPAALRDAIAELSALFAAMDDERLAARGEDIRAVGRRLLLELHADAREPQEFPARTILVGDEVSLTRIADVPQDRLAGIVCFEGSVLSHTVVVARALGIPAVMGIGDHPGVRLAGRTAAIDGYVGRLVLDPVSPVRDEFRRLEREERALTSELDGLRDLPARTPDGVEMTLCVNTGLLTDIEPGLRVAPSGVGLYRSEFPFMLRETFPSEDEQYNIYRAMLEAFAPRPVVMRSLDIGGDKPLTYFPIDEANSLLGWRGIRVTLQNPEIFLVQLKAMLRANAGLGNLHLLLPMVSVVDEVRETGALLDQALESLAAQGVKVDRPPLGVMLEVPLTLFSLHALACEADFFSLGTNDLTQYLAAADRGNPRVAALYDHLEPAVLRALQMAVTRARELGKPISVCGELAADPAGVMLLMGMGVESLSTAPAALPRVKWIVRSITRASATALLERALEAPDGAIVRRLAAETLEQAGLGGLIRAGR